MMNVEGAAIEKQVGKTILPLFHAFFSFGTVIGAGRRRRSRSRWGMNVFVHTQLMAVLIVAIAVRQHRERSAARDHDGPGRRRPQAALARAAARIAMSAWREPRTYALGVIILGMAFAEGGANDWLALGVVEDTAPTRRSAPPALAVFSVSMTVVRMFGGPLVDRFGRVATLRVLAATATVGLLLFILAPSIPLVFVGAALWGAGVSLGFPLGMSAAADDPAKAAARVSAAATIGYIAFLCGPPILGFISEHIGLLNTLYILVGAHRGIRPRLRGGQARSPARPSAPATRTSSPSTPAEPASAAS